MQSALPDLSVHNRDPKLLLWNAEIHGDREAMREKYLGIWQTSTWREVAAEVRKIACGLHVRGLKRGDKISSFGGSMDRRRAGADLSGFGNRGDTIRFGVCRIPLCLRRESRTGR